MNPYTLLNIEEGCSRIELKTRYRLLCKMYHPDKMNQDPTSVRIFQMLQTAYQNIKESMNGTIVVEVPSEDNDIPINSESTVNNHKKEDNKQFSTEDVNNLVTVLGQRLHDPWFDQGFSLTDYFGDVTIPEKNKTTSSSSLRPISTRSVKQKDKKKIPY